MTAADQRKRLAFALLAAACLATPILYLARIRSSPSPAAPSGAHAASVTPNASSAPSAGSAPEPPATATRVASGPGLHVLYRHTGPGPLYGRLVQATLGPGSPAPAATALSCERVHYESGSGICLNAQRGALTTYEALLFDANFQVRHRLPLSGYPSRARVSPDGRYTAFTMFESGHSYTSDDLSTRTQILDSGPGTPVIADLERLSVLKNDVPFQAVDFNFWGVTFTKNGNRFYATLQSAGKIHLIEAALPGGRARVIREGIECPSLSPDNTRIAFKKRTTGRGGLIGFQLAVFELASRREYELAETRSVDDQVLWLDDHSILYGLPEAPSGTAVVNTWAVPADGKGAPRLFAKEAESLVVLRDASNPPTPSQHP